MKQPYELPLFEYQGGLGQGGTARVALVVIRQSGLHAALKYPLPHAESNGIDFSFLASRENQLVGGIKYPGLVRVLGISTSDPVYLLLELCQGPTLERIGKMENLLACLNILASIAINLEYIHARGIIHGDLKPDNIFLPSDWERSTATPFFYTKLSDFSLGRRDSEPNSARAGIGTVGYMAPETIIDSRATEASDLFALGVIAYQLLTGHHPFGVEDHDPIKVNSRIREDDPLPLSEHRSDLPQQLVELVEALLAKQESERPGTGLEVCRALRSAGATYRFERAIQPKHLIDCASDPAANIERVLTADETDKFRLHQFANGSSTTLRLILSGNAMARNLDYTNGKFELREDLYLPSRMRRSALRQFARMSLAEKKRTVRHAITFADFPIPSRATSEELETCHSLLQEQLVHMLHQPFIRRMAAPMAKEADRNEMLADAANLYLRAGMLVDAERCAFQAAVTMRKEGRHNDSLAFLQRFLRYAQLRGEEFVTRQLLMLRGDILKELGEAERAEDVYFRMIDLYRDQPVDCLLAETYKDLGDLYKMKRKSREGIDALNKAIKIYEELDDRLETSHTLNNLGNIYWIAGDARSSFHHYLRALRIQRQLDAKEDLASTLTNLGAAYGMSGRFKRAVKLLELSLHLKREIGNRGEIARSLNNLGFAYFVLGASDKAISALTESLEMNQAIGSKKELLFNFENLTHIIIATGKLGQSVQYLRDGMALAAELNDRPHVAVFNLWMATVFRHLGRVRDAQAHLRAAQEACEQLDDFQFANELVVEKALLLSLLGQTSEALSHLRNHLAECRKRDDKLGQLQVLVGIASIEAEQSEIEDGLRLAASLELKREERILKYAHFRNFVEHNDLKSARELMTDLEPELRSLRDDIDLPRFLEIASRYYHLIEDTVNEEKCLNSARAIVSTSNALPRLVRIDIALGKSALEAENVEAGYKYFKSALETAKKIASTIETDAERQSYQSQEFIQYLVAGIRDLSAKLVQNKRAGVQPAPQ